MRCDRLRGGDADGATRLDGSYILGMAASEENLALSAARRCELCGRRAGEATIVRLIA